MNLGTARMQLGRYCAFECTIGADLSAAQALRAISFRRSVAQDADNWDNTSLHILIRDKTTGALVCCYRLGFYQGAQLEGSYSAQFYGLDALHGTRGTMMEMGRFCVAPGVGDPDVLRLAWAVMADMVDRHNVRILFGCSSFSGTQARCYADALAYLQNRALAPRDRAPVRRAPDVVDLCGFAAFPFDQRRALKQMPPLLRSYLRMHCWVSDHAVIDHDLDTLHVFTGVDIDTIPRQRQNALHGLRRSARMSNGAV